MVRLVAFDDARALTCHPDVRQGSSVTTYTLSLGGRGIRLAHHAMVTFTSIWARATRARGYSERVSFGTTLQYWDACGNFCPHTRVPAQFRDRTGARSSWSRDQRARDARRLVAA